jgi:ATP-binding cassette subfamily C (CFTR/MRP) protein 1
LIRGSLVSLIHEKSLNIQSGAYNDGKSLTLMSTDADALSSAAEMFHETWAQLIGVVIGTIILAQEVGNVWPTPLVIIFCKQISNVFDYQIVSWSLVCSRVSQWMAQNLRKRQKSWNDATQHRISTTSSVLGSMKSVKMLGISDAIINRVEELRHQELEMAKTVRWMMVAYNASGKML